MAIRVRGDPEFEIKTDDIVTFTFASSCFLPPAAADQPVNVRIAAPIPDAALTGAATAMVGLGGSLAIVASPMATMDLQTLAILSSMSCATPSSTFITGDASNWLLSPLGFWRDEEGQLMGAVLPILIALAVHALSVAFVMTLPSTRPRNIAVFADGTPRSIPASLRFLSAAARVRFPSITLLVFILLHRGLLFTSTRYLQSLTLPPPQQPSGQVADGGVRYAEPPAPSGGGITLLVVGFLIVGGCDALLIGGSLFNPLGAQFSLSLTPRRLPHSIFMAVGQWVISRSPSLEAMLRLTVFELRVLWFLSIELLHAAAVVCISSAWLPSSRTECTVQQSILAAVFGLAAIGILLLQPYVSTILNFTAFFTNLLLALFAVAGAAQVDELSIITGMTILCVTILRSVIQMGYFFYALCKCNAVPESPQAVQAPKEKSLLEDTDAEEQITPDRLLEAPPTLLQSTENNPHKDFRFSTGYEKTQKTKSVKSVKRPLDGLWSEDDQDEFYEDETETQVSMSVNQGARPSYLPGAVSASTSGSSKRKLLVNVDDLFSDSEEDTGRREQAFNRQGGAAPLPVPLTRPSNPLLLGSSSDDENI